MSGVATRTEQLQAPTGFSARRTEISGKLALAVWAVVCAAAAVVSIRYGTKGVAATVVVVALAVLVRIRAWGILLGLALVGSLNGFPGYDANPAGVAIGHTQDVFALALIAGSFYVVASGRVAPRSQLQRTLYVVSAVLGIWWTITWARTTIFGIVPASLAARFARDFLYFAITLPMLVDVFVTYPRLRKQLLWTLGVFATIFASAQIVHSQAGAGLEFILHSHFQSTVNGTDRVYSSMTMLIRAGLALSLGTLILGPTATIRRRALVPTGLFGISLLLQLTRAAYFGLAVGFVVAAAIWWFRRDTRAVARKQLVLVPLLLAFLIGGTSAVLPTERHVISKVVTRAAAGFSDVNSSSGTVQTRTQRANEMLRLLGRDWPIGLGFQHPSAHPYPTLPQGSIRNGDIGILNVLMVMGLVGAILIYLPPLIVLWALIRPAERRETAANDEWLRLGAAIWIVAALASSITLQELVSFGGLQLSAVMLALAASVAIPRQAPADPPGGVTNGSRVYSVPAVGLS